MRLPHLRPFASDPLYFLTTCVAGRRPVLSNSSACEMLQGLWRRAAESDGWFVGRFLLMPDHVHLFARPTRDAKPLAQWIKMWKSVSSRQFVASHQMTPPVWQTDYFDHFVRAADSYSEKWDYVRNNPVRKNLVAQPEDWPWQGVIHDLSF